MSSFVYDKSHEDGSAQDEDYCQYRSNICQIGILIPDSGLPINRHGNDDRRKVDEDPDQRGETNKVSLFLFVLFQLNTS